MNRLLRQLAGLAGLMVLGLTQFGTAAHAGISSAVIRINLSVVTTPAPILAPTLSGNFTYGVNCTVVSGPAFIWSPASVTMSVNAATPLTSAGTMTSGNSTTSPGVCTVSQLTRPSPPLGYVWNGTPPDVVLSNVVRSDVLPPYDAPFNNVLSPATFAVTATANTGGTVSCASPVTYGNTSNCTAVASPGYTFVGFITSGCGAPTTNSSFTTAAITANCNVTAQFAAIAAPVAQNIPTLDGWSLILLFVLMLGAGIAFSARRSS
ncbi:MAG: hypothetical protein KA260_02000 [Burkholderiales bacterium]|nr:hypothetical protein [Burkholderiales bacterium]